MPSAHQIPVNALLDRWLPWRRFLGPQPASLIEHFLIAFVVVRTGTTVGFPRDAAVGMGSFAIGHELNDLWRDPKPQVRNGIQDLLAFALGIAAALLWGG